ncbi:pyridoxamine 5'-phosphate oxidase [Pontimonas sp.]|jgi:pyridoxamine 5'-phosphate oxidase|uniref:pyridoxamine 5'-phosphate oxidase n=1 Tax=Pontimonas sp. TaxID=2304492 RepID=UPI0028704F00|nr:pyridoxamine 5'-phosphate oxidase [Pontimonas sp.]MDR9434083.1 pyridoxamine 5'-phosphate oxidase [Pontimonas sp.]
MTEHIDPLERHTDYGEIALEEGSLLSDPIAQFRVWLQEADDEGIYEPNAMVVSTIDPDGTPTIRTVLLRGVSDEGFAFYTDYTSQKGVALAANPQLAAVFPWYSLHRQVKIRGVAEKVSEEDSDAYFSSRPRDSRIGAWASDQSQPIDSRAALEEKVQKMEESFAGVDDVPRPEKWGGFLIRPRSIEFWAGRRSRLHDRVRFVRHESGWSPERLQP